MAPGDRHSRHQHVAARGSSPPDALHQLILGHQSRFCLNEGEQDIESPGLNQQRHTVGKQLPAAQNKAKAAKFICLAAPVATHQLTALHRPPLC
jgi:hypothetical protein